MNHGFFNMTQKVSPNPCIGRAPVHQGKRKHGRANPNLKQWWLFLSTSEGLFTWIGCLKVRLLPGLLQGGSDKPLWTGEKKKTWNVEEQLMGTSPRQCAGTQRPVCQDIFDKAQDHHVGTYTILTWPSPMWLFFISKDQVCVKRNQVQVQRCSEGKSDGAHE